jgi:hypothetical protein
MVFDIVRLAMLIVGIFAIIYTVEIIIIFIKARKKSKERKKKKHVGE